MLRSRFQFSGSNYSKKWHVFVGNRMQKADGSCKRSSYCHFAARLGETERERDGMPKGQRLRQAIKNIICNVYAFFEEQHKKSKACVPANASTKTADGKHRTWVD